MPKIRYTGVMKGEKRACPANLQLKSGVAMGLLNPGQVIDVPQEDYARLLEFGKNTGLYEAMGEDRAEVKAEVKERKIKKEEDKNAK